MAKDTRTILKGVRVGKKTYTNEGVFEGRNKVSGKDADPFEMLSSSLDQDALNRLMDKGQLGGDWKAAQAAEAEESAPKGKKEK